MAEAVRVSRDVTVKTTITTTIALKSEQYNKILRAAVGAPASAMVDIEDYGGEITITWSTTETKGDEA